MPYQNMGFLGFRVVYNFYKLYAALESHCLIVLILRNNYTTDSFILVFSNPMEAVAIRICPIWFYVHWGDMSTDLKYLLSQTIHGCKGLHRVA